MQRVADRQAGRISREQLTYLDVGRGRIDGWLRNGFLVPRLPRVFAVGNAAQSMIAALFEAILYAGPGAMLSHVTAAWWRELINYPAPTIHVRTPRRRISLPGVTVHPLRDVERTWHKGLPVTSIPQTMLDLAASAELKLVRKALGRLDYRYELDIPELDAICRRGRRGSARLKEAIAIHDPRFGQTNSPLEDGWLFFCEAYDVPKPDQVDVWLHGIECDAFYVAQRLVVQLDGGGNHHSPAQMRRDHRNDVILRGHDLRVRRYSHDLVHNEPLTVREDVLRALASPV